MDESQQLLLWRWSTLVQVSSRAWAVNSELTPGGSPESALQIALQNMYKAKNRERA